jgi:hypothetical protein
MNHYEERVKGRSAEELLLTAGGGAGGAVQGPEGEYFRIAAQVRSTQELIEELKKASASNNAFSTRVFCLTVVLAVAAVVQAVATAWPYLMWWLKHRS